MPQDKTIENGGIRSRGGPCDERFSALEIND